MGPLQILSDMRKREAGVGQCRQSDPHAAGEESLLSLTGRWLAEHLDIHRVEAV